MVRNGMDNPWRAHHGLPVPPKYTQKKKKKEKSNFQIKLYPGLGTAVGGLWGLEEINPPIPTILPLQSLIQVPLLTIDLLIIIIIFYKKLIKNLNIN